MKQSGVWGLGSVCLVAVAGCQPMPQQAYQPTMPSEMQTGGYYQPYAPYPAAYAPPPVADVAPAAGPVAAPVPATNEVIAEVGKISERVQRVEKAMLRLDRRMQLVERNELNRMGGGGVTGDVSMSPQQEQQGLQSMNLGPSYSEGFRPVSAITSSLQAAPRGNMVAVERDSVAAKGLPSLADPSPAAGKAPDGELAVWTVKYDVEKVWPERDQLPLSRDVVEALRNGEKVTVFARGKHPQAVDFRERVRALSRYLSKVASLDSVPIAAIPAPHLDDDTIEIFATH